ncbi:MAG: hypothetical protein LBC18_11015, partial [Opitutaceae bacterium]|nr:hypothetical protein [Opitutaceae bacterium]
MYSPVAGDEHAGPAQGGVFDGDVAGGLGFVPLQIDLRVRLRGDGSAGEGGVFGVLFFAGKYLGAQAGRGAGGVGEQRAGGDGVAGDAEAFDERHRRLGEDARAGGFQARLEAGGEGGFSGRLAGVVAEQGGFLEAGGAEDGDGGAGEFFRVERER